MVMESLSHSLYGNSLRSRHLHKCYGLHAAWVAALRVIHGSFGTCRPHAGSAGQLGYQHGVLLIALERFSPRAGLRGVLVHARQRLPRVRSSSHTRTASSDGLKGFSRESSTESSPASMTLTVAAMPHAKAIRLRSSSPPAHASLPVCVRGSLLARPRIADATQDPTAAPRSGPAMDLSRERRRRHPPLSACHSLSPGARNHPWDANRLPTERPGRREKGERKASRVPANVGPPGRGCMRTAHLARLRAASSRCVGGRFSRH